MVEAASPPSAATARERVLCPHCHAEVEVGMAFCLFCGARLVAPPLGETAEAAKHVALCQQCGASVEEGVEVCPACGYSMLAEVPPAPSKAKVAPGGTGELAREEGATSTGTVEAVLTCPQCSAPLKSGVQICDVCGYRAEERLPRRRWGWIATTVVLLSGIGGGGWYAYHHHPPTREFLNGILFKIGVLKSNLVIRVSPLVPSPPPKCEVFLNGEARGVTDAGQLVLTGLKKGSYVIRLTCTGFEAQEQRIEVTDPEVTVAVSLVPEGMVFIPGGTFRMGRDEGDEYERPAHEVTVAPFLIDRTEVTNRQYSQFHKATGHQAPPHWSEGTYPLGQDDWPVTNVGWRDAESYCRWAGKRLPTEEEWEFAARGTDGRLYPWGNQWRQNAANAATTSYGRPAPVGTHPEGASPFKVLDMVGNVWEWTASTLRAYPGGRIPEDTLPESERRKLKVIRGGCYLSNAQQATTTYRMGWPEDGADYAQTGFRCAKDVKQ
jgi:formylglycine-generating enzyme required for sulfatase activity/ribosomal protein L37E